MLYELGVCVKKQNWRQLLKYIRGLLPQRLMDDIAFYKRRRRFINRRNPQIADEKLLVLREGIYRSSEIVKRCTDKYTVREYIKEKGLGGVLVPLLDTYDEVSQIDWRSLPDKFAIKCNHGCGMNIIVADKAALDIEDAEKKLREWLYTDYGRISGELHYLHIVPRIIVEQYIETKFGILPVDYKFHCSWGKVICSQVIAGRGIKPEYIFVDRDFRDMDFTDEKHHYTGQDYRQLRPESYEEMWKTAEKLSEDFPYVRVDLYDREGEILFGELTFTPYGGYIDYVNERGQIWIGKQICLERQIKRNNVI